MDKINLYCHGGSENHGCEAIIRSTVKLLDQSVNVFSNDFNQDIEYELDKICTILNNKSMPVVRGSKEWLFASIQTKMTSKIDLLVKYRYKNLFDGLKKKEIFLSVGGDNYCYDGTKVLAAINHGLRQKKCKTVLWGCSVEPKLLGNDEVAKDIAGFNLIIARESISYGALKEVNKNTYLVPDPAFILDRTNLPLPEKWLKGNMIGINASPLILESSGNDGLILAAYKNLIHKILNETTCGIVLIPHVVWKENDDRIVLRKLYQEFKDSERVILLDDYNCMELKGFIARCRMFIGARTHATIAAYSSCVPTLVLGYSVKSRGIAKDLFGTEEKYVLPVNQISSTQDLAEAFGWLLKNENQIRDHLTKVIPTYIEKVYLAKELLEEKVLRDCK